MEINHVETPHNIQGTDARLCAVSGLPLPFLLPWARHCDLTVTAITVLPLDQAWAPWVAEAGSKNTSGQAEVFPYGWYFWLVGRL